MDWQDQEGPNVWMPFEGGDTLGKSGSEEGISLQDEDLADNARITLERDTRAAPFAITCGIYGWLVHTRFFATEAEGREKYAMMKQELARILTIIPSDEDPVAADRLPAVEAAVCEFVERFP